MSLLVLLEASNQDQNRCQVLQHCKLRSWTTHFQAKLSLRGCRGQWKEVPVLRRLSQVNRKEQFQQSHLESMTQVPWNIREGINI